MSTDPSFWQNLVKATTGWDITPRPSPHIKIRAILTDFNGVISNKERTMREAYAKLQEQKGGTLPDADTALSYADRPRQFLNDHISDSQKMALFKEGRALYDQTPMHLLEGAAQTMQHYDDRSIPWAVVSNNQQTRQRWHEMGLDKTHPNTPVFDHAKKPGTAAMERALEALNQPAGNDIIMVDDEWKGLTAAAKLGLTPVYFGQQWDRVRPQVEKALRAEHMPIPTIPIVRNNQELIELINNGLSLPNEISPNPHQQAATQLTPQAAPVSVSM